jgi:hypothetical protein
VLPKLKVLLLLLGAAEAPNMNPLLWLLPLPLAREAKDTGAPLFALLPNTNPVATGAVLLGSVALACCASVAAVTVSDGPVATGSG